MSDTPTIENRLRAIERRLDHLERLTTSEDRLLTHQVGEHARALFGTNGRPGILESHSRLDQRMETLISMTRWILAMLLPTTATVLISLATLFFSGT